MDNYKVYSVCANCQEGYYIHVESDSMPCPACKHVAPVIELDDSYTCTRTSDALVDAIGSAYENCAWSQRIQEAG